MVITANNCLVLLNIQLPRNIRNRFSFFYGGGNRKKIVIKRKVHSLQKCSNIYPYCANTIKRIDPRLEDSIKVDGFLYSTWIKSRIEMSSPTQKFNSAKCCRFTFAFDSISFA